MKQQKTNEGLAREVLYIILLVVAIAVLVHLAIKKRGLDEYAIEDLHQQQEMIDYHRSQGREITVNR